MNNPFIRLGQALAFVCGLISLLPGAAADETCDPRLETAHQTAQVAYNAFDQAISPVQVRFVVRNAAIGECTVHAMLFRDGAPAARSVEHDRTMAYRISGPHGEKLAEAAAAPPEEFTGHAGHTARLTAGMSASFDAVISVPRGQTLPPGEYTDTLAVALYRREGQIYRKSGKQSSLGIRITVQPVMRVMLAGGGLRTTLDFGELTAGTVRSVNLLAHANQGFRLRLHSEHNGTMRLTNTPGLLDAGWHVPYTISINRGGHAPIGPGRSVVISDLETGLAGLHIPVEVRIGDVTGQRAGIYRDVITIEIEPRG